MEGRHEAAREDILLSEEGGALAGRSGRKAGRFEAGYLEVGDGRVRARDWLLSEDEPEGETNGAREYDAGTFVPGRDASSAGTAARSRTRGLKHWAWLSGVAIAVIGAYLLYQAVTAKLAMSSLLGLLNMDGYIGGETVWVNGVETPIVDFLQNNPVSVVSTVWLIVGAVLVLGGIALAVFLKRKFRT